MTVGSRSLSAVFLGSLHPFTLPRNMVTLEIECPALMVSDLACSQGAKRNDRVRGPASYLVISHVA